MVMGAGCIGSCFSLLYSMVTSCNITYIIYLDTHKSMFCILYLSDETSDLFISQTSPGRQRFLITPGIIKALFLFGSLIDSS